nr:DEAD/DEAH box helicase [Anaerolineae bacterium]
MELADLLEQLRHDRAFQANTVAWEHIPAHPARYAGFPARMDPRLVRLVRELGLAPLYTHQAQAISALLDHENVALVTGTASGKSLAYFLPTLQFALSDPAATALYLFPTKALAQDQAAAFGALLDAFDHPASITHRIYDGDTPSGQRTSIRRDSQVIISNPDMLHMSILPYHARWARLFQNLRLVVIDELHTYRGIFGSHMANVLRRMKRICAFHGSNPVFICTSATTANPQDHASRLLEMPVTLIDQDGSPKGEKHIILYNPPFVDEKLGIRRSYMLESRQIAARFLAAHTQTIVFARSRLATEVLLGYLRDEVQLNGGDPATIRGYRGGYLPLERREIEQGLRNGAVQGVVATNALELGIDIGALGASILAGYPGTIASTWQQFGRAGRRADVSMGLLVASGGPLDQFIARNPAYIFESSPEHTLINPDNLAILVNHLRCAAYELPFRRGEAFGTFEEADVILDMLAESGELHYDNNLYTWVDDSYPAAEISLRTSTQDVVIIQEHTGEEANVIGEVDRESAPILVYEGAVYMHEGEQYLIDTLDWEHGLAVARRSEVDYYTSATSGTSIRVEDEHESRIEGDCVTAFGRVVVTTQATGYRIIRRYTHETLGFGRISLPPQSFETTAYWFYLTPDLVSQLEQAGLLMKPNNYGPDWPQQREAARARDGYRCTRCTAPEQTHRQHDVHHIRPFREFGYVPGENDNYLEANQLDNLTTLCAACHREVESTRRQRSALAGLANIIRNLSALLLMCTPGDIGVVADAQDTTTHLPTITVYDHAVGGLGLSARLFDLHNHLMERALDLVRGCPCPAGCPACIGPVGEIESETKALTIQLLEVVIQASRRQEI